VLHRRFSDVVFGSLVIAGTAGAFFAPPFTGLDTLPVLGVVLLSLGVLLEDLLIVGLGLAVGIAGVARDRGRQRGDSPASRDWVVRRTQPACHQPDAAGRPQAPSVLAVSAAELCAGPNRIASTRGLYSQAAACARL
jgi:hypothetical protein